MLNRRQLKRLNLPPGTMDAVLRLHEQEVASLRDQCSAFRRAADEADALRRERDELAASAAGLQACKAQAETLQQQLTEYRAQTERQAHRTQAEAAVRTALLAAGANPRALPLLLKAVDLDALALDPEAGAPALRGGDALTERLKGEYADFFAEPQSLAVPTVQPPAGPGGMLTAEAVRGMDAEQINANWSVIRAVLSQPND